MTYHDDYQVRNMTLQEVQLAANWAGNEGWNPGLSDAKIFYNTDPEGFFVGLQDGEHVAVISAVRYADQFGFIGFFIARPDVRDEGYGFRLAREAMRRCRDINTGLDGVLDKVDHYTKIGFKLAYRNGRWRGLASYAMLDPKIVSAGDVPFETLCAYDRQMFPADRRGFLKAWINEPTHRSLAYVDGGRLRGFGVIRPCMTGYKIGPLFCDDASIAKALYDGLAASVPVGSEVFWDTPMCNEAAVGLAKQMGMTVVFETARMYSQGAPKIDLNRVFGVTTFELG